MKKRLPHIITHTVDVETETHESLWPIVDVSDIGKRKNMENEEKNTGIPSSEKSAEADAGSELLPCPDCAESARMAYSDATTPGFMYSECPKHRASTTQKEK